MQYLTTFIRTSPLQKTLNEATTNDSWGVTNTQKYEIADATNNKEERAVVLNHILYMIKSKPEMWRAIYKSINLLDFVLKNTTSDEFIKEITLISATTDPKDIKRSDLDFLPQLNKLKESFEYIETVDEKYKGRDRGGGVRTAAEEMLRILASENAKELEQLRKAAKDGREWMANRTMGHGSPKPSTSEESKEKEEKEKSKSDNSNSSDPVFKRQSQKDREKKEREEKEKKMKDLKSLKTTHMEIGGRNGSKENLFDNQYGKISIASNNKDSVVSVPKMSDFNPNGPTGNSGNNGTINDTDLLGFMDNNADNFFTPRDNFEQFTPRPDNTPRKDNNTTNNNGFGDFASFNTGPGNINSSAPNLTQQTSNASSIGAFSAPGCSLEGVSFGAPPNAGKTFNTSSPADDLNQLVFNNNSTGSNGSNNSNFININPLGPGVSSNPGANAAARFGALDMMHNTGELGNNQNQNQMNFNTSNMSNGTYGSGGPGAGNTNTYSGPPKPKEPDPFADLLKF